MAERLRLELRTRITPSDRLAICSNTIIGPFHIEAHLERFSTEVFFPNAQLITMLNVLLYGVAGRLRTSKGF